MESQGRTAAIAAALKKQLERVVFGQDELLNMMLVALFAGGHVLIEGVPGTGKTLAARTLAGACDVSFTRVQLTPDVMPADITGINIFDFESRRFNLKKGPVFTNFLLADEINRTPPKTQSALLEAMEEESVSIDGTTYRLDPPFMVFATQNPLEFEGTYPLPEAQLDRFMMKLLVGYPEPQFEAAMLENWNRGFNSRDFGSVEIQKAGSGAAIAVCREEVRAVTVDASVIRYIIEITAATRKSRHFLTGASPRAAVSLMKAAKALACMEGRSYVIPDDAQYLTPHVFRHRVILTPDAEMDGVTPDRVLLSLLEQVKAPR